MLKFIRLNNQKRATVVKQNQLLILFPFCLDEYTPLITVVAMLVCFLSLSHRSPTQESKQPAFILVAQKNPLLHLIYISFFPVVLFRLHIEMNSPPSQLYTEELAG